MGCTVSGNAWIGGALDLRNNAWIGGEIYTLSQAPPPCGEGYDLAGQMGIVAGENGDLKKNGDLKNNDWLRGALPKRLREEFAKLQVEVNEEKSRTDNGLQRTTSVQGTRENFFQQFPH